MSVIIRLQNLPWSANSMDIRNFFRGLSIPEGGVHIVGGEQGDAFIAFSTDEDARQAMLNNGGRLKEVQVKLLLSSRSEMLKVIETARQAVTFMQLASQPALPAQPVVTQPSPIPTAITGMIAQNLKQLQQVPGLPINNILTNTISKPIDTPQVPEAKELSKSKESKFDRRRSRSSSRERHKKERSRDKKDKRERSRSRDRSRDRDRRRRDRSRSRERRDRKRDRSRERVRSKDRNDRYKDDKKVDKDLKQSFAQTTYANKSGPMNNRPGLLGDPKKRFAGGWASEAPVPQQNQPQVVNPYLNANPNGVGWNAAVPQNMVMPNMVPANPSPALLSNPNIPPNIVNDNSTMPSDVEQTRINELDERRNPNAFQHSDKNDGHRHRNNYEGRYARGNSRFRPNYNRHEGGFRNPRFKVSKDTCLKVSNMSDRTLYKDIRRFFNGLFIPNSGLKLINDQYGKYTGVAFVRFSSTENKYQALERNGRVLNGHNVVIEHLDDGDYDNASDLQIPGRRDSPEREEELDVSQDLIIVENDQEDLVKDPFKVLYLEDLPAFAKEQDIMKMFSDYSLLSILIFKSKDIRKQFVAYVEFVHADDAKAALQHKNKHLIGHINIKVTPCSDVMYEQAKLDNTEQESMDEDNGDMEDVQNEHLMDSQPVPENNPVSRDPRQRRFENKPQDNNLQFNNMAQFLPGPILPQPPMQPNMFSWRPTGPANIPNPNVANGMMGGQIGDRFSGPNSYNGPQQRPSRFHNDSKLDCVFIKGLPLSATDKDVLNLFADLDVTPIKIHLMLTLQGEPSGDCFCEFIEANEASLAVTKNGGAVGMNRVTLELVPKSVVNDALGKPNTNNFMGGGGMGRGFRGGRGRGRGGRGDWRGRGGRGGYGGGPPPQPMHSEPTEGFGSPGTVVSLENVPYRATINEILDFFCDFKITQQDIIRRFNENGQPTGDARVNLHNAFEAQKAVNMLNMRKMRDRTVTLSILQTNN